MLVTSQEDDGAFKDYGQWLAVEVIAAADGSAAYKKAVASGQMRKLDLGWFLVRYEDGGVEEWLRIPGDTFNNNARSSWRVDLDFEASGGIEGSGAAGRRRWRARKRRRIRRRERHGGERR